MNSQNHRFDPTITRRALLRTAAGAGAGALMSRGLPAWAKPILAADGQLRKPGSRPFPHLPAGHPSMPEIKHIVVLMMENHSFDNLLGMVPYQVPGRQAVDGLTRKHGRFTNVNRDTNGTRVFAQHADSPCQLQGHPGQNWNASHESYDGGRNDGFVKASGPIAMRFWDQRDLPFTYSLARHFPIGERYFCSVLAQTYPNRRFFFAGTASGIIATNGVTFSVPAKNGTIFDRLDAHHIGWRVYYQNAPSLLIVPGTVTPQNRRGSRLVHYNKFHADAAAGRLPAFTFIDPEYDTTSEENPQDIQVGERFVADVVRTLMRAPTWKNTALFITYDEHGGYYDHVPPPPAIPPDSIRPLLNPGDIPGGYNRYGFRVPTIVVSPWAKPNYVSSMIQDHTSILAFMERKWNLPAMTFRDANAQPMTDYFDFSKPAFLKPPPLHKAPALAPGLAACHREGLNPPLPPGVG
ncbi:MAG TPA: alkaline phosphatase family protein [Solirubrobacteraceae bacterium]|nr:alkaline phosphatase family protein [Solirubrobacteraceae bacterium]